MPQTGGLTVRNTDWDWTLTDDQGDHVTWEGMVSVRLAQAAQAEAALQDLLADLPTLGFGPGGPLDEGFEWDCDVHRDTEGDWLTLTVTLVGPSDFAQAVLARWASED